MFWRDAFEAIKNDRERVYDLYNLRLGVSMCFILAVKTNINLNLNQ